MTPRPIDPAMHQFLALDAPAMLTGMLAAMVCGLLGNFLVLRRQSLMGDAIAHAVLPGLVLGFLLTGVRSTWPMLVGATAAALVTVALSQLVRRFARLESGAAMGVVFSTMFALGVVLIERAAARGVDLDPDCVLSGQLERVFWFPPSDWSALLRLETLALLPREMVTLLVALAVCGSLVAMFFKELRIACFDPALATAIGLDARLINGGLMVLVAIAVVASFEAVGSILVIAMLVCPAATARLLTDRLSRQVWLSLALAAIAGIAGYWLAARGPAVISGGSSLSATGMITVAAGLLLAGAIVLAPRYGVASRWLRRRAMTSQIAREDALVDLLRLEEEPARAVRIDPVGAELARQRGEALRVNGRWELTPKGRARAIELLRAHRLWESYLVGEVGLRPDHVHQRATELEHVSDPFQSREVGRDTPPHDPHGRPIPRP